MHSLHGSPRALSPYPPAQDVLPPRQNAELLKLPGVRLQVGTGAGLPSATAPEPAIEGKQLTAGGEAWRAAAAADMKARLAVEAAITAAAAAASGSGGADGTEAVEAPPVESKAATPALPAATSAGPVGSPGRSVTDASETGTGPRSVGGSSLGATANFNTHAFHYSRKKSKGQGKGARHLGSHVTSATNSG